MSNQISRMGAPSFVIYITGLSFIYFLTSSISSALQSLSEGTELANQLLSDSILIGGLAVVTLVEIFFLRRNMRLVGGFGIGAILEAVKTLSSMNLLKAANPTLFVA
ncbi:MAG: hypothetical protein ACW981_20430, partial [Candidatus Hodarchaeales archaeon]